MVSLWLLLLELVSADPTHPLDWKWSNPAPSGTAVSGLAWRTNRLYLAPGERGRLQVAAEPTSWRTVFTGTTKSLRAATYLGNRAVVVGEAGVVLWSDDDQFQKVETGRTNWIEAVAASADRLVAVGDAGLVLVSTNGVDWTASASGTTQWLRAVAYGSGLFLAVGEGGYVASSPDGRTWTQRAAGRVSVALNAVAPVSTGFLAVGDNGTVLSSRGTQLSQWDASRINTPLPLLSVVAPSASERLVGGGGECWFGIQVANSFVWSSEVTGLRASPAPVAEYQALVFDGSRIVAGTRNGVFALGTRSLSFAGFSWSHTAPVGRSTVWDSTFVTADSTNVTVRLEAGIPVLSTNTLPTPFRVAVGERAQILDSVDGRSWNVGLSPASATNTDYFGIASRPGLVLAAGSGGAIARSLPEFLPSITTNRLTNGTTVSTVVLTNRINLLGIAWDAVVSGVTNDLQGVAMSDTLAVVAGSRGAILTSTNGTNWTRRTSGTTAFLSSVASWPGGFVATGEAGTILASPDGIRWTTSVVASMGWIWKVRWLQDRLVAVGQGGAVLSSTDGLAWNRHDTGTNVWWNDVVRTSDAYYLAGDSGMVAVSADLGQWTLVPLPTLRNLYTATAIDDRLVVAGASGGILRARLTPYPQPVRLQGFPKAPEESLFLFEGEPDQSFVFERSGDLREWSDGNAFEITDPSGLLILVDTTTNAVPAQFFRTRSP